MHVQHVVAHADVGGEQPSALELGIGARAACCWPPCLLVLLTLGIARAGARRPVHARGG